MLALFWYTNVIVNSFMPIVACFCPDGILVFRKECYYPCERSCKQDNISTSKRNRHWLLSIERKLRSCKTEFLWWKICWKFTIDSAAMIQVYIVWKLSTQPVRLFWGMLILTWCEYICRMPTNYWQMSEFYNISKVKSLPGTPFTNIEYH